MTTYPFLVEVAPMRPAGSIVPSASPVYKCISSSADLSCPVTTLFEAFERSVKEFAGRPCLGKRAVQEGGTAGPFQFETYAKVGDRVKHVASALAHVGVQPHSRVGIYGVNAPEWMIAMQACNRMSLHCVPLYDTLGENAVEYIIKHSETAVIFVAAAKVSTLVHCLDNVRKLVHIVVVWGGTGAKLQQAVSGEGILAFSFQEFEALGLLHPAPAVPPRPSDICTIMYTSGTTGEPKGVLLTHAAVLCTTISVVASSNFNDTPLTSNDTILSYLPLAHIFDRTTEETILSIGASIGYWQGDVHKLADDILALKPTLFVGVPRVFDRIYKQAMDKVESSWLKKIIYEFAKSWKLRAMKAGVPQAKASPLMDIIVFRKFKKGLGGRVRMMLSGGAPLAPHIEELLRVTMCAGVVQGYGLTETCAASFIARPDDMDFAGTVGLPMPMVEFRLESAPELGYDALDERQPQGELLLRTPQMFSGYYKDAEKTREVLEEDGWFHTGDIGAIMSHGGLKIIDRKKNIFKLSQGEYIAAESLEASYGKNKLVEQIWVYGDSYKSCLVAVVVPDREQLEHYAATSNTPYVTFQELCGRQDIQCFMLEQLVATGKAEKLRGFEIVKGVLVEPDLFSVENNLLTPTFKLKRNTLKKKYEVAIEKLYAGMKHT